MRALASLLLCGALAGCGGDMTGSPDGGKMGGGGAGGGTGGSGGAHGTAPDFAVAPTPDLCTGMVDMVAPADLTGGSNTPYPAGPYGVSKGKVIDAAFSWDCLKPGESTYSKVTSKDFFDPDGSRKINALLLDASYLGCPYCEQEAQSEEGEWDKSWKDNGAVAVTLLSSGSDPKTWVSKFSLKHIYVCKDPNNSLKASGYPSNVVVDPRTMKVSTVISGYSSGALSPVTDLAKKNKM